MSIPYQWAIVSSVISFLLGIAVMAIADMIGPAPGPLLDVKKLPSAADLDVVEREKEIAAKTETFVRCSYVRPSDGRRCCEREGHNCMVNPHSFWIGAPIENQKGPGSVKSGRRPGKKTARPETSKRSPRPK